VLDKLRDFIYRWRWPLLGGLATCAFAVLWLAPAERTLGDIVKLVYLHGALLRTAVLLFAISLPVNLVVMATNSSSWASWGIALGWVAAGVWWLHALFGPIPTYATWGIAVAWYEPRTRFTFILAGLALVVIVVEQLVRHTRFGAAVLAMLAGLALYLVPQLDLVQHPLDPIGSSSSGAIRAFYAALLLASAAIGGVLTVWAVTLKRGKTP
jgi:hypothetical protein